VRFTPQPWGTELEASVSGIRPGTRCQIWATTASGQHASGLVAADPAGTFVYADSTGNAFTFTAGAASFGTGS
jgi:hypothetical protein